MKGELLLQTDADPGEARQARAADCCKAAIDVAPRHGARLFELRASANLVSLVIGGHKATRQYLPSHDLIAGCRVVTLRIR